MFSHIDLNKMDNSNLTPSLHLLPDWLKGLLEDCDEEAKQQRIYPIKLMQREIRCAVWNLCAHFGFEKHGVPGQACRLLERYLSVLHRDYVSLLNAEEWKAFKMKMTMKTPLLIATCIQLGAKMSSAGAKVNATIVRVGLLCKGASYDIEDINSTEFNVYSALEFRIPLWTSVEAGELLALEVGMPSKKLEEVAATVNFAEYRRDSIEKKVRQAANLTPNAYSKSRVRTLHLVAGAVAASARFPHAIGPETASRLADLTRAPLTYIKCICDVICTEILTDDAPPIKRPSKRKMPQ